MRFNRYMLASVLAMVSRLGPSAGAAMLQEMERPLGTPLFSLHRTRGWGGRSKYTGAMIREATRLRGINPKSFYRRQEERRG